MDIKEKLKSRQRYVEEKLSEYLPSESAYPEILFRAMRYSVFAGGKRLRPILLLEVNKLFDGDDEVVAPFACALEMIHTYSLIHDDLPAMDDDNFRRGRLTSHKAFGEGMAILAGDALLNHAFEVMSKATCKRDDKLGAEAMYAIAFGAGVNGMIAGQVVDILSEGKNIDKNTMNYIHLNKTSALIQSAFRAGGILGGANEETITLLNEAAVRIGMAFQIQDDILDVTGTQEELGKSVFSDSKNEKTTYISLFGLEESNKMVEKLSREAIEILESFGDRSKFLIEITKYLMNRRT